MNPPAAHSPPEHEIVGDRSHSDRYRALLVDDWSLDTLDDALDLLEELLRSAGISMTSGATPREFSASSLGAAGLTESPSVTLASVQPILDYIAHLHADVLPASRPVHATGEDLPPRPALDDAANDQLLRARRTRMSLSYPRLFVPAPVRLTGNVGLYRDIQSIVLQIALLDLLPELASSGPTSSQPMGERAAPMASEHDALVLTMLGHIDVAWHDQPAHQTHLRGQVFDYLGDADRSGAMKRLAFEQTPRTAHDYLTTAQIYWSHLVDIQDYPAARRFALTLLRDAPAEHLDEIQEIYQQTIELGSREDRPGRPADQPAGTATRELVQAMKSARRREPQTRAPTFSRRSPDRAA